MINPMMIIQMMQSASNPMQAAQQLAAQNPELRPALQIIQGKSPQQLEQTFYNLCQSHGVAPEQVARQCGVSLPQRK